MTLLAVGCIPCAPSDDVIPAYQARQRAVLRQRVRAVSVYILVPTVLTHTHLRTRFISTMETETIASRNVVDLLLHDEYNAGICPASAADEDSAVEKHDEKFVLGWDCR